MTPRINKAVVALVVALLVLSAGALWQARAQEPRGYWLYVDGTWKGGFIRREECDAAARASAKGYECRPVHIGAGEAAGAMTPADRRLRGEARDADIMEGRLSEPVWRGLIRR